MNEATKERGWIFHLECGCGAGVNFNVFSNRVHSWINEHENFPVDDEDHVGVGTKARVTRRPGGEEGED